MKICRFGVEFENFAFTCIRFLPVTDLPVAFACKKSKKKTKKLIAYAISSSVSVSFVRIEPNSSKKAVILKIIISIIFQKGVFIVF